jgi:hypothetical protein
MGTHYLTRSQKDKLNRLIYFLRNPQEFGCTIDKGDPESQALIKEVIDDAAGVVDDFNNPPH